VSSPRFAALCGLFVPRERMASALETLAGALPATYAYDALARLADDGALDAGGTLDVAIVLGLTVLGLVLAAERRDALRRDY
jgi:ABC-2 type transport system permease protein